MPQYTHNLYPHGGSRFWFGDNHDRRDLLVDTYCPGGMSPEQGEAFARYVAECAKDWLESNGYRHLALDKAPADS